MTTYCLDVVCVVCNGDIYYFGWVLQFGVGQHSCRSLNGDDALHGNNTAVHHPAVTFPHADARP